MQDRYSRNINYLRVSVTDRCNLQCIYCQSEIGLEPVAPEDILTTPEIIRVCRCAASLGVHTIKLTGGEPLVRDDIEDLVGIISAIDGIDEVTMTSNGLLMGKSGIAKTLFEAGLHSINISLDTLNREIYARITGVDAVDKVIKGIEASIESGMHVKINCVPMWDSADEKGSINNIIEMASIAKRIPVDVRFIETMPIGEGGRFHGILFEDVKKFLEESFGKLSVCNEMRGHGPASYYSVDGFPGKLGFIQAETVCFCERCNRLRLTATGFLKPCLRGTRGFDLREMMRMGAQDFEIRIAMERIAWEKPENYQTCEENDYIEIH